MNRFTRSTNWPLLLLALTAAAAMVYDTMGERPQSAKPTSIATVSLARVLENLDQRSDAERRLAGLVEEVRAESERRDAEINALQEQLKGEANPARRLGIEEQLALKSLNYQAWVRFKQDQQDVERALLLTDLYRSIKGSIAEMAETEGYDAVVVDDSQGELAWTDDSRLSREAQVLQQIRGRRLLYTSRGIDITDDLVARMNNAFRMGTR